MRFLKLTLPGPDKMTKDLAFLDGTVFAIMLTNLLRLASKTITTWEFYSDLRLSLMDVLDQAHISVRASNEARIMYKVVKTLVLDQQTAEEVLSFYDNRNKGGGGAWGIVAYFFERGIRLREFRRRFSYCWKHDRADERIPGIPGLNIGIPIPPVDDHGSK